MSQDIKAMIVFTMVIFMYYRQRLYIGIAYITPRRHYTRIGDIPLPSQVTISS